MVLSEILNCKKPETIAEKKKMLLENNIALWDVVASCDITGSSDLSIKNVKANDIEFIIENSRIERIFTNGTTACRLYKKYILPKTHIEAVLLPSTSPANAAKSAGELIIEWKKIIGDV